MIREVIFMLSGQSGALFTINNDGLFEICAIDVLSPSEKDTLKPLMKIGSNVAFLIKFIEDRSIKSLYLEAIKKSVAQCLCEYQETLMEIEETILEGSTLFGLTGIHSKVLSYTFNLEYLKEFVDAVKLQSSNCLLLDTIKQFQNQCGISKIITTFETIYNDCLRVLHKQLISWLLFGKLLDPHGEFFIKYDDSKQLVIVGERIPNCLNVTLAQQVLFVGESVVALSEAQDMSEEDWEFMAKLQQIPFHQVVDIIQCCQDQMARRLWDQVSENDRLNRSLAMICNTFLMKKGDIFAYFIQQTEAIFDSHLNSAQHATAQFALQQKLSLSLKKYLAEEEVEIERLSLKLAPETKGQSLSTWDRVFLEYRSEWPLGVLIFTPETMETYNKVFRLLLKLKRIHLHLNGLWKMIASWKNPPKPILELRWNLQHVLVHLSQYIQTDVVEVQKSIMERQIHECHDFNKFRAAHANFLVVVASQTFLHVPAMQACFKDLMDLALKFCNLFREDGSAGLISAVDPLNKEFESLMQLLFSLLNGMYQQSTGTSMEPIAQLLLRLDFNYYLTEGLKEKARRLVQEI